MRIAYSCLLAVVLALPWVARAGETSPAPKVEAEDSGKSEDPEEKKKKKKIPPFKCSAWCSFRDFGDAQRYDSEAMRKDDKKFDEKDESRAGANMWSGYARRGQWVSLVVELQNTTEDKPYAGNIRVQLDPSKVGADGEKPYTTRYRQSFEMAPKTTQSFYFCVLCPEFDFGAVEVLVTANGGEFMRSVRLRDLDAEHRDLIVVVSDRAAAFNFLMKAPPKGDVDLGPQPEADARSVAVVQPSDLPNRWYNLTLANLIIIDGPPRDGLKDDQLDALQGYCQAGGHVLISSGLDPARLRPAEGREKSIADLVGFRVRDLKRVKQLDCAPGWTPAENDTGLPVVDVTPNSEGGAVAIYRNAQTGLVERMTRQIGMGTATFFAFSLSEDKLKTWPERAAVPLNLLEEGRRRTLFAYQEKQRNAMPNVPDYYGYDEEERVSQEPIERFREQMDGSFSEDTPVETPKRGVVASFLLLYLLVAVPLNYFIFGWFRRREIGWAAVPVWALFFSIGAYVVGYQQGRLTVDQLTVMEAGPNQTEATARTFMGVFAPRRGNYQFRFERDERLVGEPQAGPGHLVSRRFQTRGISGYLPEMDILEEPNGDLVIEDLLIYARSTRRLEVQHRAALGKGIELNLTPQGEGKTAVSVQNRSPYILLNAVLAYRGGDSRWRVVRIGNLAKNMANPQNSVLPMGPNDGQGVEDAFFSRPPYFPSGGGQTAGERAKSLGAFVQSRLNRYQDTLLLAWIDGGMLPVTISRGDRVQEDIERGMTLLVMPVGESAGGGRRNWSGRFTTDRGRLERADWDPFALKNGPVRIAQTESQAGETNIELQAPRGVRNLQERQFSLSFQLRAMTQQEYAQREAGMYNYYNNMPSVPSQYSGEVKVEICRWKSDLTVGDYRTVYTGAFRQLKAGERQNLNFQCALEDRDLGPRNTILMRVRLGKMSVRGEWSEVNWPLDLLGFEPELTGRDAVRR